MRRFAPFILVLIILSSCASVDVSTQPSVDSSPSVTPEPTPTVSASASPTEESPSLPNMDVTLPASTPPEPDLRPENIWYHYYLLDSEQKVVYLELYENLIAYIENDEVTELFSLTIENTESTIDGRGVVMRMAWDNPVIALYFGSHIDVTDEDG